MSHPCFVPSASFSLGVNPPSPSPMESEATAVDDEQLLNRVSSHGADLDTDHHNLHGNSDDCEAIFVQHYNSDDVLLGRGKSNQKHPGNIHFRSLIKLHREPYFAATSNLVKKAITEEIVRSVQGRFLKRATDGWYVMTGHPRRVKVAQALQYRQRRSMESSSTTTPSYFGADQKKRNLSVISASSTTTSTPVLSMSPNRSFLFGQRQVSDNSTFYPTGMVKNEAFPPITLSSALSGAAVTQNNPFHRPDKKQRTENVVAMSPDRIGSSARADVCLSYGPRMPFSAQAAAAAASGDDRLSFDDPFACEPQLVSDDDILWALGYDGTSDSTTGTDEDEEEDVDDMSCHIGYTTDEYQHYGTSSVAFPTAIDAARVPVSPDHALSSSSNSISKSMSNGAAGQPCGGSTAAATLINGNSSTNSIDRPMNVRSTTTGGDVGKMPELDIFSALERAGFLETTEWSV